MNLNQYIFSENYKYKILYLGRVEYEGIYLGTIESDKNGDYTKINEFLFASHGKYYNVTSTLKRNEDKILEADTKLDILDNIRIKEPNNKETDTYQITTKYFIPKQNEITQIEITEDNLSTNLFRCKLPNNFPGDIYTMNNAIGYDEEEFSVEQFIDNLRQYDKNIETYKDVIKDNPLIILEPIEEER